MTDVQPTDNAEFLARLKEFEGRAVGPPEPGADPVNQPMIRHWCEAIGDELAVYTNPDAATASVHGGVVAPPVMLQAWTMRGIKGRPATGGTAQDELMRLLDGAGFTSVVATNCEQTYARYLHPGDHLSVSSVIDSVSEEKKTGLGVGHFVTTRQTFTDQTGEVVGTMLFRILKFRPAPKKDAAGPRPLRPRPAVTHDTSFWFEGAKQHKLLIQRCVACGRLRHPPEPMCSACGSFDWDTIEASGRGRVYSFVVNHYPQVPSFDYPLAVGLIELEEGIRLIADIVGIDPSSIVVDMKVQAEFVDFDPDLTLPVFRPAGEA
jgi:3-oxo-4,17-pregnadiene-20-carboxyl-CoA hydratase alpha subunit